MRVSKREKFKVSTKEFDWQQERKNWKFEKIV